MTARRRAVIGSALLAAVLVTACDGSGLADSAPPPTPEPITLTVLHTNDNWGETKPCG
jgi:2',3'-cyclic-nucleotide 2'-phosphodiesterase (5'-nucleotidase family)